MRKKRRRPVDPVKTALSNAQVIAEGLDRLQWKMLPGFEDSLPSEIRRSLAPDEAAARASYDRSFEILKGIVGDNKEGERCLLAIDEALSSLMACQGRVSRHVGVIAGSKMGGKFAPNFGESKRQFLRLAFMPTDL